METSRLTQQKKKKKEEQRTSIKTVISAYESANNRVGGDVWFESFTIKLTSSSWSEKNNEI